MKVEQQLSLTKSTKNTHVFTNDGEGVPVQSLYIQKSAFEGKPPEKIRITIEEAE